MQKLCPEPLNCRKASGENNYFNVECLQLAYFDLIFQEFDSSVINSDIIVALEPELL